MIDGVRRTDLFNRNYGLIVFLTSKIYRKYHLEFEDAVQIASLAVWLRLPLYDESRGKISTFMQIVINTELKKNMMKLNECQSDFETYESFDDFEEKIVKEQTVIDSLNRMNISERDRQVFLKRLGFGEYKNKGISKVSEIASEMNMSDQNVSRIFCKIINIMQIKATKRGI